MTSTLHRKNAVTDLPTRMTFISLFLWEKKMLDTKEQYLVASEWPGCDCWKGIMTKEIFWRFFFFFPPEGGFGWGGWVQFAYNVVLVSAVQGRESAICTPIYSLTLEPPSHCPHPTHLVITEHQPELSMQYLSDLSYICQDYSLNLSHPLSPLLCPEVCFLSLCFYYSHKIVYLYCFARFHIHALICDIWFLNICVFW